MVSLQIYIPYFGTLPNYFQLYLDSLAHNHDCLTVFLLTNIDLYNYDVPDNLIRVPMKLSVLRERFADCINRAYETKLDPRSIIRSFHKLTDFKILYPAVFEDIGQLHGKADFVGWGDCDLIYGRLSDFLNRDAHAIGSLGHLNVLKNVEELTKLFRHISKLPILLSDNSYRMVDELIFQKVLQKFLQDNHYERLNLECVNMVPDGYVKKKVGIIRHMHNFTSDFNLKMTVDNIVRQIHVAPSGELMVTYVDGQIRPVAYCHLQKKNMVLNFERADGGYYIYEKAFSREVM